MPTRYDTELQNRKNYLLKGSIESVEFTKFPVTEPGSLKLPPYVWLMKASSFHFLLWSKNDEEGKDEYYNYRRFQSDARLLEDSVKDVPASNPGK